MIETLHTSASPLIWTLLFAVAVGLAVYVGHHLGFQDGYDEGRSQMLLERAAIICTRAHADPVAPRYGPQRIQDGPTNAAPDVLLGRPPHHYDQAKPI